METYDANGFISADLRHYPLYLSGDGWSVGFQERPQKNVVVNGRPPTYEELTEVLSTGNVGPFLMAKCLFVAAQSAFRLASEVDSLRRERDAALAELERAREVLREARDAVEGRTAHLYRGDCPSPRHWLDRDPECPACALLIRIDTALAAKGE